VFGDAAQGVSQRRLRRLPTPHAMFVIPACGVAHLRRRNFISKLALFNYLANGGYTFFALRFKIWLCNRLIISADLI
jgi:hypothetical protein